MVDGDPAVLGKVLQHRHQELQTPVPMAKKEHHSNEIEDAHDGTRKVISHVEDLDKRHKRGTVRRSEGLRMTSSNTLHLSMQELTDK